MYRAGMISLNKEIISEANKLIFDFIWKGKDKVKRLTLINDIEDGGLKAPYLFMSWRLLFQRVERVWLFIFKSGASIVDKGNNVLQKSSQPSRPRRNVLT